MNMRGAYQKKAQNVANLRARYDLLVSGIKAPRSLSKTVLPALAGQRAFAALNIPKLKIYPMALNTMKSLSAELYLEADDHGNKGFAYLDSLRVQLKASQGNLSKSRSVETKAKRVEDNQRGLSAKLLAAELQSLQRSRAYYDLYSKINALVKGGALDETTRLRLFNMLDSHHVAFGSFFAPGQPDNDGGGVVVPFRSRDER